MEGAAGQRVLVIGLDGFDIGFAERLMAQGELPALRAFRDRSARFLLDHGVATRTGLAWEHFASGLTPESAQRSSVVTFDPSTYAAWQEGARFEPFLARLDARCVVFDAPYVDLAKAPDMSGIVAWGAHDPGLAPTAHPGELIAEIPCYPGRDWLYGVPWPSVKQTKGMGAALAEGIALRSRVANWLLADRFPDWDLAVVVASEPHAAAEAFWHGVEPTHPLHGHASAPFAAEALTNVYREADRFVATLVETFHAAHVVVFSMNGMGPNDSDIASMVLLPELMFRWARHSALLAVPVEWSNVPATCPVLADDESWDRASAGWYPSARERPAMKRAGVRLLPRRLKQRLGLSRDAPVQRSLSPPARALEWQPATRYREWWRQMGAFALPSFYDGRIRVNLRGRERDGIVDPSNYATVLEELESLIRQCRDPRTGESAVETVERPSESDPTMLGDTESDLVVVWNKSLCALEHPEYGLIGPVPYFRTGGHTGPYGFALVEGSRAAIGDYGVRSAFDVAPTVVDLVSASRLEGMDGRSLLSVRSAARPV
jgi:predicted AlkP superfamily phosphohydrolase/phosphomutase